MLGIKIGNRWRRTIKCVNTRVDVFAVKLDLNYKKILTLHTHVIAGFANELLEQHFDQDYAVKKAR